MHKVIKDMKHFLGKESTSQSELDFSDQFEFTNNKILLTTTELATIIRCMVNGIHLDVNLKPYSTILMKYLSTLIYNTAVQDLVRNGAKYRDYYLPFNSFRQVGIVVDVLDKNGNLKDLSKYVMKINRTGAIYKIGYYSEDDAIRSLIENRYLIVPVEGAAPGYYIRKKTSYKCDEIILFNKYKIEDLVESISSLIFLKNIGYNLREDWHI